MTGRFAARTAAPYLAACLIAVAFFGIVEAVQPYYFLQDDNRDIFLPLYVHNYRAALDGQLAQFNFFQSLGKPHFATGYPATLHPVPYVSVFLSELLFGHVFASVEILVLIYLILGAASIVYLVRLLGFSGSAGVFGATAWCLSPFNALTSQSWTTYAPMIGLMPWILIGALLVYRKRSIGACAVFVVAHLAVFYIGAPQFFLYAAIAEGVFIVWLLVSGRDETTRADILRILGAFAVLTIIVTLLCMPLLVPMWHVMQESAFRGGPMTPMQLSICRISLGQLLNGLFAPFTDLYEPLGPQWCQTYFQASFTHQGFAVTLLILAYPLVRRRLPVASRRAIDACFAAGIVLIAGALGLLTPLASVVPIMDRLRWPFKYFGFGNFLLVAVCAAPAFDALMQRINSPSRRLVATIAIVAFQFVNLLVLDVSFRRQAFFEHLDAVPLTEPLRDRLVDQRIVGVGCKGQVGKDPQLYTAAGLGYAYSTLWELHNFGGYDPLVSRRSFFATLSLDYAATLCPPPERVPVDYLRHWGVQTYILNEPVASDYEPMLERQGLHRVTAGVDRMVMVDPQAPPMVGSPDCALQGTKRVGDDFVATVQCRRKSDVVLRFLIDPRLSASVDGAPTSFIPNDGGFLVVPVPGGRHDITLQFDDPLIDLGMWLAAITLAVVATAAFLLRRRFD